MRFPAYPVQAYHPRLGNVVVLIERLPRHLPASGVAADTGCGLSGHYCALRLSSPPRQLSRPGCAAGRGLRALPRTWPPAGVAPRRVARPRRTRTGCAGSAVSVSSDQSVAVNSADSGLSRHMRHHLMVCGCQSVPGGSSGCGVGVRWITVACMWSLLRRTR